MEPEPAKAAWQRFALTLAVGLFVCLLVYWLWGRLSAPKLGQEGLWFGLAWLMLLAGPAALGPVVPNWPANRDSLTFSSRVFEVIVFVLALVFLAFLVAAPALGNYKLWLGLVYLAGLIVRLGGLSQMMRSRLMSPNPPGFKLAVFGAAISAAAGVLVIPWVRTDLVGAWPVSLTALGKVILAALLWGGVSGSAFLLLFRLGRGSKKMAWLVYLAVGLGPGPALAVGVFPLLPLAAALLILFPTALLAKRKSHAVEDLGEEPPPLQLYWLVRAMMLLWWGLGAGVTLALAWWRADFANLLNQESWPRALIMGAFFVICLGLLAEYTLPLMRRKPPVAGAAPARVSGVILSALTMVLALSPLLLMDPPAKEGPPEGLFSRARSSLLKKPVTLGPKNRTLTLTAPGWLSGVSRIFVVSILTNGAEMAQGQPVLQMKATDQFNLPHFFVIRAGIDTAEWALAKRDVSTRARHKPARVADSWTVYTATGETFSAHHYFTGIYLGRAVEKIKSITLTYIHQNRPGVKPVRVVIGKVFVF